MAKDVFHQQVKKALIKDGWIITQTLLQFGLVKQLNSK